MNLDIFNGNNLFKSAAGLFEQLGIKLNSNMETALQAKNILGEHFNDRAHFKNVKRVYFSGLINDGVFSNNYLSAVGYSLDDAKIRANRSYNGLMIFTLELEKHPTRTQISELTRAFNRVSQKMPVALLFQYGDYISFALPERFLYKQEWRQGEKVGKVIILRDIKIQNTHEGHQRILKKLSEHNAKNFSEFHSAWLKVLDIQTLNAEFYKNLVDWYAKCFDNIQIDLNAASKILDKKIDDELKPQAVIRVIIRLMFIWFMKEKGLITDKFFTREFADQYLKKADTFYNAILQNLFFAVLNKKIDERRFRKQDKTDYYNPEKNDYGISDVFRFKDYFKNGKADEFLEQTKMIPFVNGGLFTCHDFKFSGKDSATNKGNTEKNYIIDGFSDNKKDKAQISDTVIFELIDLFNSYVWTIEESTPTEQDVALDPELLGTVFENLIGFYNPETKENARKQTGSFYTPREIVDYMCKESLKESLKTKFPALGVQIEDLIERDEDQLNFPEKNNVIAAITDLKILDPACGSGAFPMGMFILMVRTIEKLQERKTTYKNKLDVITNCIYGVDIQNIAIEISKLRFLISLLVDYQTPKKIENFEVLPNLETKFIVANSLIGIEKKDQGDIFGIEQAFKELTKIFLPFTTATTPKAKEKIKNDFEKKKQEIVNNPDFEFGKDTKEKILQWSPFNVCYSSPFFDSVVMFGIADGFDIVIGNPPYVEAKKLKKISSMLNHYEVYSGTADLSVYFLEKGFDLLKDNGLLTLITTNKFFNTGYGKLVRKKIIKKLIKYIVDFEQVEVFDNVLVSSVTLGIKNSGEKATNFIYQRFYKLKKEEFKKQFVERQSEFGKYEQELLTEAEWSFSDSKQLALKEKIENAGVKICELEGVAVFRGVTTGYNPAFIIGTEKKNELIIADKNNKQIIKPLLQGRNIRKWIYHYSNDYLIFTKQGIDIENYLFIKNYLNDFYTE
ncbi:MAG: Eco57I restriction-modification methylase domain-containing protein, partial [Planctomycetaceae bacterium]|nr:Eco57I restriction-modification methylase domain-containing protein [Planctomycetaceae bacterium]